MLWPAGRSVSCGLPAPVPSRSPRGSRARPTWERGGVVGASRPDLGAGRGRPAARHLVPGDSVHALSLPSHAEWAGGARAGPHPPTGRHPREEVTSQHRARHFLSLTTECRAARPCVCLSGHLSGLCPPLTLPPRTWSWEGLSGLLGGEHSPGGLSCQHIRDGKAHLVTGTPLPPEWPPHVCPACSAP